MWPNNPKERNTEFYKKRKELLAILNPNFALYSLTFGAGTVPGNSAVLGERGILLEWINRGRSIDFRETAGARFVSGHNLGSWVDNAVAFNLASDVLEQLFPDLRAPRIYKSRDEFEIKYPLPGGRSPLDNQKFSRGGLNSLYSLVKLPVPEIRKTKTEQVIQVPEGIIVIDRDCLKTQGFQNRNIPKSSFIASRLMCFTNQDFNI